MKLKDRTQELGHNHDILKEIEIKRKKKKWKCIKKMSRQYG